MSFHLKAVSGADFVDREAILNECLKLLKDPNSTDGMCFYGLRRMGKTSLMFKLVEELTKTKATVPVYLSLWDVGVREIEYFSSQLVSAILEAYAPKAGVGEKIRGLLKESKKWVVAVLKSFKLSLEIAEQISTAFSFEGDKEKKTPDDIIELPFRLADDLAKAHSCKTCLFLDEFPDLVDFMYNGRKLNVPIVAKVRTVTEVSKRTALSIAGSIRRTMNLVAVGEASPFYRQFIQRELGPFGREAVAVLLKKNLRGYNKIEELTNWMLKNTGGVPFYIQYFGRMIEYTGLNPLKKEGERALWSSFLEEEAPLIFRAEVESLNNAERRVLDEASFFDKFTYSMMQGRQGKAVSNIGQWLTSLTDKGVLSNPERGVYHFADPIFQRYLNSMHERK